MARLHSGFGSPDGWDYEYEGTRQGWAVCFRRLKYGMEVRPGGAVRNLIVPGVCVGVDPVTALRTIRQHAPKLVQTVFEDHMEFAGVTADGALFSASTQRSTIGSMAYVQCLLFDATAADAGRFEAHWKQSLAQLFPAKEHAHA